MAERVERVSDLPPCKRHITTHDAKGKSVYTKSSPQQYMPVGDSGGMARSYAVASIPATLTDDADIKAYLGQDAVTSWYQPSIVTPNGANLLVVDLAPGATSTMHQTVSIDFSICTIGEIEHELDSGETVLLRPGDHIVQRGTNHRWRNASQTEPARFVAVTISCEPFDVAGKMLEEMHVP
ncbi:hypothetical protein LTR99_001250 [Exophiala xenobiotica]|uniref:Cupin type-2 domain-containing protein n=1 Tax=Vermiconidia calcicola TaxID=1690605 RepID=A0AAV9QKX7_9PEZI|nr:hypothetical protein LTR92_001683 [Exophiala xenobiotica]KAK5545811.1 hypothetical protein LTR25_000821 [Vermiconidia calcicola]KAK5549928.1 hypothetical protein LTR23_000219 [Chaetothyriales sp. CCFEE 6169]KAK5208732.1 hypothetical protein LTR41_005961 [Exophiala xenobiotica]KAK5229808.1 hypothetical protein LTR72_001340 [Exophiala xenobiotica]